MASLLETGGHAGDEGNFEALYRTYKSEVHRLASYLLRNSADAEDASQTVFLNVLRALRQGVKPAEPRAWLLAITRNVCFSRRRAGACRPDEVELDPETVGRPEENGGPSADEIVGALARMLPKQRTALILRDFRGVPRAEISELLQLSPTGVEALLARARTSFREELEADRQPFDCAETRTLVEQQLEGLITVAERHSLRTHLRHCASCSSLARVVRSSRGKLASLLPWTVDWFSRLAAALSQAPTAVHVAGAISSTAFVASVAIPVALVHGPGTTQTSARTTPAPARHHASTSAPAPATTLARSHTATGKHVTLRAHGHAAWTARAWPAEHVSRTAAGTTTVTTAPVQRPATAAPVAFGSTEQQATGPTVTQPYAGATGTAPRSTSPAVRPPTKAKPARRAPKRGGKARHAPAPPNRMPASTPPASDLPPAENGAVDGSGPGFSSGSPSGTVNAPAARDASASAGSGSSSNAAAGSSSGDGRHKHNK